MSRRVIAATLALLCIMLGVPGGAQAVTNGDTYVVGDSLTYRGSQYLAALQPEWTIDGVPRRHVDALPALVESYIAAHGYPDNLVIALGTNRSTGWTKADYGDVVGKVPADTQVFFVTVYRDPAVFPSRARILAGYTDWMDELADGRAKVHIVPWRHRVIENRAHLQDGVHATTPDGEMYWANLVNNYVTVPYR